MSFLSSIELDFGLGIVQFTNSDEEMSDDIITSPPIKRGTKACIDEQLAQTLDRCKVSDRNAFYILMATARAWKQDTDVLILNRSSIRRTRAKMRKQMTERLKEKYKVALYIGRTRKKSVKHLFLLSFRFIFGR